MARTMTVVNKAQLINAINQAENNGPLKNLDCLWIAAAEIYNRNTGEDISKSVVMLRATKEWNLTTKTKPGKKGRSGIPMTDEQKAAMQAAREQAGPRVSRAEKFKSDEDIQEGFEQIKKETPVRFEGLVQRLTEQGSMKAGVAIACLQCTVFQPSEIRRCHLNGCGLYAFRPYKGKAGDDEVENMIDDELVQLEAA